MIIYLEIIAIYAVIKPVLPNYAPHDGIGTDSDSVANFLSSCVPSMEHHAQVFIGLGCNSTEYFTHYSIWSPQMIEWFPGQLPPNERGNQLSKMDKLVLMNHFHFTFVIPDCSMLTWDLAVNSR